MFFGNMICHLYCYIVVIHALEKNVDSNSLERCRVYVVECSLGMITGGMKVDRLPSFLSLWLPRHLFVFSEPWFRQTLGYKIVEGHWLK